MEKRQKVCSMSEYGDASNSSEEPLQMAHSFPKGEQTRRIRKYSWSRTQKCDRLPRSASQSLIHVTGMAIVVFGPDGSWFRANIVSSNDETFALHGTRRKSSKTNNNIRRVSGEFSMDGQMLGQGLRRVHYRDDSGCESEDGIDRFSESDSLEESLESDQSDLFKDGSDESVAAVLGGMSLSESSEDVDSLDMEGEDAFDAFLLEHETCQTHQLGAIQVSLDCDRCELKGSDVQFSSSNLLKGNAADRVLCESIGPSFTGRNLDVYQGEIHISYKEVMYESTPTNPQSRWYL